MSATLQARLAAYLKKRPGVKVAKGELEDKARALMGVTAETVGRRLRVLHEASCVTETVGKTSEHMAAFKLAEGGRFMVEHRAKNHAFYWYEPPASRVVREVVVDGGVAREVTRVISNAV
jgi:hypothetical protein